MINHLLIPEVSQLSLIPPPALEENLTTSHRPAEFLSPGPADTVLESGCSCCARAGELPYNAFCLYRDTQSPFVSLYGCPDHVSCLGCRSLLTHWTNSPTPALVSLLWSGPKTPMALSKPIAQPCFPTLQGHSRSLLPIIFLYALRPRSAVFRPCWVSPGLRAYLLHFCAAWACLGASFHTGTPDALQVGDCLWPLFPLEYQMEGGLNRREWRLRTQAMRVFACSVPLWVGVAGEKVPGD